MDKAVVIAALLIVITAIALTVHVSTTDIEFSRYNHDWTGTSEFFTQLEAYGAEDVVFPADLSGRNDTLLLIIAPSTSFSPGEISSLKDFLADGNTLFIADEAGSANGLLEGLGSDIRIHPGNISSVDKEFADPGLVIGYPRQDDPILTNVSALTLNGASALSGGIILVSTTFFSWDDTNGNYNFNKNESLSSFGLLSRNSIGNGTLYVLSDPSIFINGMMDAPLSSDNDAFIENMLFHHPVILVEQSHSLTAATDEILAKVTWIQNTMVIKISLLILCILLVAVAFYRRWV